MAGRREIAAVYAAAVIQGVALVTFPAVGAILTNRAWYGLSTSEYGGMFIPQALTAILSSLLGAGLARRIGGKNVLLLGLGADLAAMALLFASQFARGSHSFAYGILLAATAFLGAGFGFAVPALNTFTAAFFPASVDAAVLALNALLGLGTALAPVFAALFVGLKIWWGLPFLMAGLIVALLVFSLRLPLREGAPAEGARATKIARRFWVFAGFALLYGVCETMNANWAAVYMNSLGASVALASAALTVFWATVTGGRVLFATIGLPQVWTYRALPLLLAAAFIATALVPRGHPGAAILSFGLAGLGCSALLPLAISFGQEELTAMPASVAGGLIGFYQMGYGLAAFGVGPLHTWGGMSFASIYGWTALPAVALAALAFVIAGSRPAAITDSRD